MSNGYRDVIYFICLVLMLMSNLKMTDDGESAVCQGDVEIVEINDDDDDIPVAVKHCAKSSKKLDWTPCLNGYTQPSYSFPQMITKALALCPGHKATAVTICDYISHTQPYYKYYSGNWKKCVHRCLVRNKNIFVISETNEKGEDVWSFSSDFEKYMIHKWLPKYLKNNEKLVTLTDAIVKSKVLTSPSTVDPSNTSWLTDRLDNLTNSSQSFCGKSLNSTIKFHNADKTQQFTTEGLDTNNRVTSLGQSVTCHYTDVNNFVSKPEADTQYISESSSESVPEFALADPDQLEDYQTDETFQSTNPLEPEVTESGNEPPSIVRQSAKPPYNPDSIQIVPNLNGYTKPSYSFPRMIAKALALCPGRRATALTICDHIADMQPYYKYYTGNWRGSVYKSLIKSKNVFVINEMNENGEYVWSFNPNFEKAFLNSGLGFPKYFLNKKLFRLTDDIVESETVTRASSVAPSNTSLLTDNLNTLTEVAQSFGEKSSLKKTFPNADKTQTFTTEGFQPLNWVTSSGQSVNCQHADLNHLISQPGAETQYVSGSSSIKVQDFPLEDPEHLQNYQPDETCQSTNPLEPEVTVSENLPDIETMRAVSSITDFGKAGNQEIPHQTSECFSTDFSLNNLNHPQNISFNNEELQYREKFHKVHPAVEKFRIHCTVCDAHLGTAGLMAQENVRLHASLGVLTCKMCYDNTKCITQFNEICHWCCKIRGTHFSCSTCPFNFCETCIDKNFGIPWRIRLTVNKDWQCFLCDKKQLWPHRAVAFFLLCHYEELKKRKSYLNIGLYKNCEPPIFLSDLSTCCKELAAPNSNNKVNQFKRKSPKTNLPAAFLTSTDAPPNTFMPNYTLDDPLKKLNPVIGTELNPSPEVQTDNRQKLIIEKPSETHVVVQAPTCVSSLTVNTGTQYIHNIYPDKSYVYIQPPTTSTHCLSTNKVVSHEMPMRSEPNDPCIGKSMYDPILQVIHNYSTSANDRIVADRNDEMSYPDSLSTKQSSKLLALQEKIKKKPMPKSKKQSLLQTVLMSESIESMKKHLQSNDSNPSNGDPEPFDSAVSKGTNEEFCLDPIIKVAPNYSDLNAEEPILKSVIETATDRLLNHKKKPIFTENIDNSKNESTCDEFGDNCNAYSKSKQEIINNQIPKIKLRSVEELQEKRPNCLVKEKELNICINETNNILSQNIDSNEIPKETNVTELKQSIIEASRTLVSTQKKFKELAKNISNKLTFQTEKATEMVKTFQDILKCCQKQIDVIDKNVTSQYFHIFPQGRKAAVRLPTYEVISKLNASNLEKKKQKTKPSIIHFSRSVALPVKDLEEDDEIKKTNNLNDSSFMTSHNLYRNLSKKKHDNIVIDEIPKKRKRDLVDFNPLDKEIDLGCPEITQEDLEKTNDAEEDNSDHENDSYLTELAKRKLYLKNIRKRTNVWSYKSRKRTYKKNNSVKKKIRRSILNTWNKTECDGDVLPKIQSRYKEERLRKRKVKTLRPLRSSERKHPSSAALAASIFTLEESVSGVISHIPVGCIVKPCSVVVHKLDARIVELMEKRVQTL